MAWTDPLQIAITPLETCATTDFDACCTDCLNSGEVETVVFGLPTHADGHLTPVGEKVLKIIAQLKAKYHSIKFDTIDESFTSHRARNLMVQMGTKKKKREKKENIDQMSAVLILRDYLNKIL